MSKKTNYQQTNKYKPKAKPLQTIVQPVKKRPLGIAWEWLCKRNFKWIFWISFGICSMLTFYWVSKAGVDGDGPIESEYASQCINYYLSGGKDTTCLNFVWKETSSFPNEKYYGTGFEGTFILLQRLVKTDDIFQFRLYYLALWSVILLFFISLIAKEFTGWKGAVLALWLTFLWSFILGQFFWNAKDVPHALGFAITIFFFLRFLRLLPNISIKNLSGVALGIAIALSVRIGGALLVAYIGLFSLLACICLPAAKKLFIQKNYKQILKIIVALFVTVALGILGGLLFYPNFFVEGFSHLTSGVNVVTNYPQRIPFIFEGSMTDSLQKPSYYLLKMFYISTPMLILVMLHAAILVMLWKWKKTGALNVFILLFTMLFPFAYMMWGNAPVYNGWRHILFAGVTITPIIAIGYKEVLEKWRSPLLKWLSVVLLFSSLAYLAVWNIRYAPYQLGYYNCLVGGTKGAYKKYEFDQLLIATSEGIKWILNSNNPNDYSPENPLVIAINSTVIADAFHIPKEWQEKLQMKSIAFRSYASTECDYTVLNMQFATPQILSFFWPPKGIVYERTIDDVVILCVMDRRNDTDYRGIKLLQNNEFEEGVKLLEESYSFNPKNYSMFYWLGYGYYRTGNFTKAIEFLNSYKKFYNDKDVNRILGYAYYSDKQYENGMNAFNIAYSHDQNDLQVAYMLGLCLLEKKDYIQAETFLRKVIERNPSFTDGQNLLQHIQQIK